MNGRLGDFGLAKVYDHGATPGTTRVVGTLGYLAPELTKSGKPTTRTDVYAFGAVMLEVVCGKKPLEPKALPEELILVDWVWEKWQSGAIFYVVDTRLNGEFEEAEVVAALKSGLMCSNNCPGARRTMRQVVNYLEGESPLPEVVPVLDFLDDKKCGVSGGDGGDFVDSSSSSGGADEPPSSTAFSFSSRNDER